VRVAVVTEYYPRRRDPVRGAWAHRQAIAARHAGAEVTVLALERPLPNASAGRELARGRPSEAIAELRAARDQPRYDVLDGIEVEYVRFVSPPRDGSYGSWHRWARRPLERALDGLHAERPLDLVHAHYALPAGGAVLPWVRRRRVPLVVSVHGGDLLSPLLSTPATRGEVAGVLREARVVLANSTGMLEHAAALAGAGAHMRVVHPPGEPPPEPLPAKRPEPTVATVGAIDPRKRHRDVLDALARLPDVRWLVVGDGPERPALEAHAATLGVAARIEWAGALPPHEAVAELARCHVLAMPSVDEAFGVAYVEALACGLPAIGCRGEPGPEELARETEAMRLVPPRDPEALARAISEALGASGDREVGKRLLEECGPLTVAAYEDALR
jgi:glycosyltransferase involved in cell wall biosynthesis